MLARPSAHFPRSRLHLDSEKKEFEYIDGKRYDLHWIVLDACYIHDQKVIIGYIFTFDFLLIADVAVAEAKDLKS